MKAVIGSTCSRLWKDASRAPGVDWIAPPERGRGDADDGTIDRWGGGRPTAEEAGDRATMINERRNAARSCWGPELSAQVLGDELQPWRVRRRTVAAMSVSPCGAREPASRKKRRAHRRLVQGRPKAQAPCPLS